MNSTGYLVKQGNTVKLQKLDKLSSLAQVVSMVKVAKG